MYSPKPTDTVAIQLTVSQAETALRILKEARDTVTVLSNDESYGMSDDHWNHIMTSSDLWAICRILRVALNA